MISENIRVEEDVVIIAHTRSLRRMTGSWSS